MIEEKYKDKINQLITVFKEAEKQLKHSEHDTKKDVGLELNQVIELYSKNGDKIFHAQ